jgi:hypothetical protein
MKIGGLFFLGLLGSVFSTIKNCGTDSALFHIDSLALIPDPPVPNKEINFVNIFTNPGEDVTDGSVITTINYNGLPFTPQTDPLCSKVVCPIVHGSNDRSAASQWPADLTGKIVSKIEWYNAKGVLLLCFETSVKVALDENTTNIE